MRDPRVAGQNFIPKANLLLRSSNLLRPILADGLAPAHGFGKRRLLVGCVLSEELDDGFRIARFPAAAVGVKPGFERFFSHGAGRLPRVELPTACGALLAAISTRNQ